MRKTTILSLLTALILVVAMSASSYAISFPQVKGHCVYKNGAITSDFDASGADASQASLEPGDEIDYVVTYTNKSKDVTRWYMINEVLDTLEKNSNPARNGGYTYKLENEGPDGTRTVLFDNTNTVGGYSENMSDSEKFSKKLEGLKQATDSTGKYFFIQELKPKQSGKTILHVSFDGESEVNDYMDTEGALMVQYAVEKKGTTTKEKVKTVYSHPKTGDTMDLLKWLALMAAAALVAVLAIISWRRDRRKEGEDA